MGTKMFKTPTIVMRCDGRRERKDGTCPIRIKISFQGKEKLIGLNIYLTKTEFKSIQTKICGNYSEEKKAELLKKRIEINGLREKAEKIISEMDEFSFELFEKKFSSIPEKTDTVYNAFNDKIKSLTDEGRIGNASIYKCTLNALKMFRGANKTGKGKKTEIIGGKDLFWNDVTPSLLTAFEKWYLGNGHSPTGFGIYIRNLRVLYNEAILAGLAKQGSSPFGSKAGKYVIPSGTKRNMALTLEEVGKLYNAKINEGTPAMKYRDYWVFSYLGSGINVKDMARLKYKNIDGEAITFVRAKTATKKKANISEIAIPLTPQIGAIIDRWGTTPKLPENYIFPILKSNCTPTEERIAVVNTTSAINRVVKDIAKALEINKKVSCYTARHSWATIMKKSGASVEFIAEALGHSDTKVTQNYLESFELDAKRKMAEVLTKF